MDVEHRIRFGYIITLLYCKLSAVNIFQCERAKTRETGKAGLFWRQVWRRAGLFFSTTEIALIVHNANYVNLFHPRNTIPRGLRRTHTFLSAHTNKYFT